MGVGNSSILTYTYLHSLNNSLGETNMNATKEIISYKGLNIGDVVKTVDSVGISDKGTIVGFKQQMGNDFQQHIYVLVQYTSEASDGVFKTTRPMKYKQIKGICV